MLKAEICRYRHFLKGVGHFQEKFLMDGASPTSHCWCQKTTVIALSCGIKISTVHCLVLSQSMCVSDRQTDGQNYDSQDHASIAVSHCKNEHQSKKPASTNNEGKQWLTILAVLQGTAGKMLCFHRTYL